MSDVQGIAVVGMACRFPGAENPREYWENLRNGVESITRLSDAQLAAAGVDAALIADPNYVKASASLQEIDMWDAPFFGFNPKEAAIMDPQHRLFLECAWEALEDAGHPPSRFPGSIAVYAGCGMQTYFTRHLAPNRELIEGEGMFLVRHTGNDKDFLATRVSYCFDLRGPSMNIQTACSTSLVAIHVAAQSLLAGECDMALAGGVSIELPHAAGYLYKEGEVASPDGHCRAFDAAGQGTLFGSGAGAVILRRLEDALNDGDHIYAIIRGSAVNNDGAGKVGYLAPSVEGQVRAAAEALSVSDVDPATIEFLEAHGTGTPVGDPIEISALALAYQPWTGEKSTASCAIGSVKTNFGHLDTAAGVASFAKAALALQNEAIPSSLHFSVPNPAIDFQGGPFFVNTALRPWPRRDTPRRAAVNSLGVGGTNAHVILEEAPAATPSSPTDGPQLLVLSARNSEALSSAAENLAQHLQDNPQSNLADVAFTLREGRHAFAERRAIVVSGIPDAVEQLRSAVRGPKSASGSAGDTPASVAFMFAGGGAQRPGMARELHQRFAAYRGAVDEALALLQPEIAPAVREILLAESPGAELLAASERPGNALPALFIAQYALARTFQSWGISPTAMIGHSLGEYTAAHLAGVFDLRDALRLVALRGRLFETVAQGGMLSVQTSPERLRELLPEGVAIAAENAPELAVASGPLDKLDQLERKLGQLDISCTRVRIDVAAHSPMLEPILDEFRAFVRSLRLAEPRIPFVSNLTGDWIESSAATDPEYWVRHLRNTVRFADGVARLLDDPHRVLLEIGPGRTLATLSRAHPLSAGRHVFTSMRPHDDESLDDESAALVALGALWTVGVDVDWTLLRGTERRRRVSLPTYPFQRQRHWIDAPVLHGEAKHPGSAAAAAGGRLPAEDWFFLPEWEKVLAAPPRDTSANQAGTVIVLDNGSALAEELVRHLPGRVVIAKDTGRFHQAGPDTFEVDVGSAQDFEQLFDAVSASGEPISHVLHLLTLEDGSETEGEYDALRTRERRAFYSLVHLAQGWGQWGKGAPAQLVLVSNGIFPAGRDVSAAPWKSLALGPARVIPAEYPELGVRTLDISLARGSRVDRDIIERLLDELAARDRPSELVLRRGGAWRPRYQPLHLELQSGRSFPLRDQGVYVITGGMGGIGFAVAEELAARARARVVLVGRNVPGAGANGRAPLGDAGARYADLLRRCEAAGGQLHAVAADISTMEGARDALAQAVARFGAVHGVFHAAGVLNDGLLQLRSDAEYAALLAPKVRGTIALHDALREHHPDFLVLFSSISAMAGLPGQVDYAAANAFMDAFAAQHDSRDSRVIAVEWAAWRGVGMLAQETPSREALPRHPLLQRTIDSSPQSVLYESSVGTGTEWVVGEHRLRSGTALVPGTGYLEIATAAATETLHPEDAALEISDVAFLAPLVVPDDAPRSYRVALRRNGESASFVIAAQEQDNWYEMASGRVAVRAGSQESRDSLAAIRARCARPAAVRFSIVDHPHLALGPRWNCVKEVSYGVNEAVASLALPSDVRSDVGAFRLHPALLDMATACALDLLPDYHLERDFYVPLGYSRLISYAPLRAELVSHIRLAQSDLDPREIAVFDITLYGTDGELLADIEGFMMTRVTDVQSMLTTTQRRKPFRADAPQVRGSGPTSAALADAIRPSEGVAALFTILAAGAPSNIIVSWRPPEELAASMRQPLLARTQPRQPESQDPVAVEIEAALASHEAVESCAAVLRKDRTGTERIVCYVVFRRGAHATVSDLRKLVKSRITGSRRAPSNFITLDRLPRTAAGAVDRAALPDPFGVGDDHVAPRTPTESAIAEAWKDALGVSRVSVHDNFFDIGGHSLLAVRVVTRLDKQLGVRLSQAIMVLRTLEQIAAECDRQRS